jgi:hypothetical protein
MSNKACRSERVDRQFRADEAARRRARREQSKSGGELVAEGDTNGLSRHPTRE